MPNVGKKRLLLSTDDLKYATTTIVECEMGSRLKGCRVA